MKKSSKFYSLMLSFFSEIDYTIVNLILDQSMENRGAYLTNHLSLHCAKHFEQL
jgi:hypothetical protein